METMSHLAHSFVSRVRRIKSDTCRYRKSSRVCRQKLGRELHVLLAFVSKKLRQPGDGEEASVWERGDGGWVCVHMPMQNKLGDGTCPPNPDISRQRGPSGTQYTLKRRDELTPT